MAESLRNDQIRQVYLITYSQANLDLFPTRQSFSQAVLDGFSQTPASTLYWACSQEAHEDGGVHYHMCIKLDRVQRWIQVKRALENHHNIAVHFSSRHINYYSAWLYVCKEDTNVLQSEDHPVLTNPPATMSASQAIADGMTQDDGASQGPPRKKSRVGRLSAFQVGEICLTHSIKTRLQLMAFANKQRLAGKTDLAEFIFKQGKRKVDEAIATAWEMQGAEAQLERSHLSRMNVLRQFQQNRCEEGCGGEWLFQAQDVLTRNNIEHVEFAGAVTTLLQLGRGKYRNILITGPTNCGKSFILQPLSTIYQTFFNPATATYAWIGAETAEVILLNDFRWSSQIIAWADFLLLLEGEAVHLPAPKTHFQQDLLIDSDVPIFCTSSQEITMVRGGMLQERESDMMAVRWKHFKFTHQIPMEQQRRLPPCGHCFAELILNGQ